MVNAYSYIRFSTPQQAKGSSLDRQLEKTIAYAKKHKLELNTDLTFRDLGISGYKGDNVKKGALGQFLIAVEKGMIPKGSTLIIESLDRLSRAFPLQQLHLFTELIRAGITIVTLIDETTYSEEVINNNPYALFGSLSVMIRAFDESSTKSFRIAGAWEKKRSAGKPLTARCPAWLKLNNHTNCFDQIPNRCQLIERIFHLAESGIGKATIAKRFNEERIPVWGRGNGWHGSYIQKILANRSVIGEFQPHKMLEKQRIPCGDPIRNYFPSIISTELFLKVTTQRKKNARFCGKVGKGLSNLFTGIAKCGYSGSPMVYVNKGKWQYLVCDDPRRGRGGEYISWTYKDFENSFLTFINELDFSSLAGHKQDDEVAKLSAIIADKLEQQANIDRQLGRLLKVIKDADDPPKTILDEVIKQETESRLIREQITRLEKQLEAQNDLSQTFKTNGKELKELIANKRDNLDFRFRLRNEIRDKIERIEVFAGGFRWTESRYNFLFGQDPACELGVQEFEDDPTLFYRQHEMKRRMLPRGVVSNALPWHESMMTKPLNRKDRYFVVVFKNGATKFVNPANEAPGRYRCISKSGENQVEVTLRDFNTVGA